MPIISISYLKQELKQHETADEKAILDPQIISLKQFVESLGEADRELTSDEQLGLANIVLRAPLIKDHLFYNLGQKFKSPLFMEYELPRQLQCHLVFDDEAAEDLLYLYEKYMQKQANKKVLELLKKHIEIYRTLSIAQRQTVMRYLTVCTLTDENEFLAVLKHSETLKNAMDCLMSHNLTDPKYILPLQKNVEHSHDIAKIFMHLSHVKLLPDFYDLVCQYAKVMHVIEEAREKMTWEFGLLTTQNQWKELFPLLCEAALCTGFMERLTALVKAKTLRRDSFITLAKELISELRKTREGVIDKAFEFCGTHINRSLVKIIVDFGFFDPNKPQLKADVGRECEEKRQRCVQDDNRINLQL
ncbi:MAG: hypothetical protein ACYCQI_06260 [Gammaproteobacteria bacterium]